MHVEDGGAPCNLDTMRDKVLRRMQSTREHPPAVDVDPEQYRLARCNFQMSLLLAFALFHLDLASSTCNPLSLFYPASEHYT